MCFPVKEGNEKYPSDFTFYFSGHGLSTSLPLGEKRFSRVGGSVDSRRDCGSARRWARQAQGGTGEVARARPSEGVERPGHGDPENPTAPTLRDQERGWRYWRHYPIRAGGEAGGSGRPGARARVEGGPAEGRGPPLRERLALLSRPGDPGALRLERDFPVSWAEEKPGTRAQSPPQSGADPSRIRPAVWPSAGCDLRSRRGGAQPGLGMRGKGAPGRGSWARGKGNMAREGLAGIPGSALRPRVGARRRLAGKPGRPQGGRGQRARDSLRVGEREASAAPNHWHHPDIQGRLHSSGRGSETTAAIYSVRVLDSGIKKKGPR